MQDIPAGTVEFCSGPVNMNAIVSVACVLMSVLPLLFTASHCEEISGTSQQKPAEVEVNCGCFQRCLQSMVSSHPKPLSAVNTVKVNISQASSENEFTAVSERSTIHPQEGNFTVNVRSGMSDITPDNSRSNPAQHLSCGPEEACGNGSHSTRYDHQSIVVLEDDPLVMQSALFLHAKHPLVSTLLSYQQGALYLLKGPLKRLTRYSRLVLVGHGSRGSDGAMRMAGYTAAEVARIVGTVETQDGRLKTTSLVGCDLGKDQEFAAQLLRAMRAFRVESKLHLRSSAVSVSPTGRKVTRVGVAGPLAWRHKNSSQKIIAWLDSKGNLLTKTGGSQKGWVVPNYQGRSLSELLEWPTHPQMFLPLDLRKKYTTVDCLEGLTWGLFFRENTIERAPDYFPSDNQKLDIVWLYGHEPQGIAQVKRIQTILDLAREIRFNARHHIYIDLYYVLNNCIYKVQKLTLDISLVGKYIKATNQVEKEKFRETFENHTENLSLQELRKGLQPSEFNNFCKETFQLHSCKSECERWGHYFMAAVFSESVRNFRTFSLFIVSVIGCEVSRFGRADPLLCTAFVTDDHPMIGENSWLEMDKRGFYGCSLNTADERTKQKNLIWLDEVVRKENALFTRANERMSSLDNNHKTELDIFGKVKVMDIDAFISFVNFFRGTKEGRKLSRGCRSQK
ncbi:hypothetical protein GN956_G17642 [Arapaima gigas]